MDKEISFQDLLTKISEIKASDIKLRYIKTIVEDTECFDVFSVILDQETPIVHVVNLKSISKGFITLRDLLQLLVPLQSDIHTNLSRHQVLSRTKAYDLAKTQLPYVYDNTKLSEIAELMLKYETNFLPRAISKKEPKLLGVILQKDLIFHCKEMKGKYNVSQNGGN